MFSKLSGLALSDRHMTVPSIHPVVTNMSFFLNAGSHEIPCFDYALLFHNHSVLTESGTEVLTPRNPDRIGSATFPTKPEPSGSHPAYTPALRRLRQEDCEFQASLDYIGNPVLPPLPAKIRN